MLWLHGFPSSSYDWRAAARRPPGRRCARLRLPRLRALRQARRPRLHARLAGRRGRGARAPLRRRGGLPRRPRHGHVGRDRADGARHRGRARIRITGALLFNGSILLDRASPTAGPEAAAQPARRRCSRGCRPSAASASSSAQSSPTPTRSTREEAADQWALIAHHGGAGSRTARSTTWTSASGSPSAGTARSATGPGRSRSPGALEDPVATVAVLDGLRELRPGVPVHRAARTRPLPPARTAGPDRGRARRGPQRRLSGGYLPQSITESGSSGSTLTVTSSPALNGAEG